VVIVFALAAAVLYGSADFLGGAASRRLRASSVLTVSAPVGALVLVLAALLAGGRPELAGIPWAAAAGACGGVGLIVFYAGLAAGPMRLVAPVSALVSTVLPVGVAIASGERPGPAVYAGGLICVLATVLVSMEGRADPGGRPSSSVTSRGLGYGISAGLMFGLFFVFLRVAATSGVLWPSALSRATGTAILLGVAVWAGAPPAWRGASPRTLAAVIGSGVLDAIANVCYVLATRAGLFGVAVVLTSLYPGVTVLLARLVLGERLRPVQLAGLLLAIAGIAVVSL
jgi:drug/metabolite transporter (DMT)-like permease